jgi:hypothetical protein
LTFTSKICSIFNIYLMDVGMDETTNRNRCPGRIS